MRRPIGRMLSSTTTVTLARITPISNRSNSRPAGVSLSKTMMKSLRRQPLGGDAEIFPRVRGRGGRRIAADGERHFSAA